MVLWSRCEVLLKECRMRVRILLGEVGVEKVSVFSID